MGGQTLTSGYTYTKTSDTSATLTINSVTGNVVITFEVTGDVVKVYYNLYLNASFDRASSIEIDYPQTSYTDLSVYRRADSGNITANFPKTITFSPANGGGVGYSWDVNVRSVAGILTTVKLNISVVWGTVSGEITINLYGTY